MRFHVDYDHAGDGWTLARARHPPSSPLTTIDEARDMVLFALRDRLEQCMAPGGHREVRGRRGQRTAHPHDRVKAAL